MRDSYDSSTSITCSKPGVASPTSPPLVTPSSASPQPTSTDASAAALERHAAANAYVHLASSVLLRSELWVFLSLIFELCAAGFGSFYFAISSSSLLIIAVFCTRWCRIGTVILGTVVLFTAIIVAAIGVGNSVAWTLAYASTTETKNTVFYGISGGVGVLSIGFSMKILFIYCHLLDIIRNDFPKPINLHRIALPRGGVVVAASPALPRHEWAPWFVASSDSEGEGVAMDVQEAVTQLQEAGLAPANVPGLALGHDGVVRLALRASKDELRAAPKVEGRIVARDVRKHLLQSARIIRRPSQPPSDAQSPAIVATEEPSNANTPLIFAIPIE